MRRSGSSQRLAQPRPWKPALRVRWKRFRYDPVGLLEREEALRKRGVPL